MNSTERVKRAITGQAVDRTPMYGWLSANLTDELTRVCGSVAAFEDKYEFDAAHIFGGPSTFNKEEIQKLRDVGEEITPETLLDIPFMPVDRMEDYENVRRALAFHKQRGRFCYVQTPGFFEQFNDPLGIENQLMDLALYPEEIMELYTRQAEWTKRFASNMLELGVDMIHVSDDWGSQRSMLFSPRMWREMIYPNLKAVADFVHARGALVSLHSDGNIVAALDGLTEIGIDLLHPWQESAGMSYDLYLEKYQNRFAIMGGLCVQTTLGFQNYERLEREIRRVFGLLRGKRWVLCTTHFVQSHCTLDELAFAYDLCYKLARE